MELINHTTWDDIMNDKKKQKDHIKHGFMKDYQIENFSLPIAILAPCFVIIWIVLHNEMPYIQKIIFGIHASIYPLLYFLLLKKILRRYIKLLYQSAFIISSVVAFYLTYSNGFKIDYAMMQMMICIYICLGFEDFTFMVIYLIVTVFSLISLLIIRTYKYQFNEFELTFVLCFAVLAVVAIISRKTSNRDIKHLFKMAHYDTLTGLANRRYLMKYLHEKIEQSKSDKLILSILFIDVDSIKNITDTMGHSYGDLVLSKTSDTIQLCLSKEDLLAKYDGDEFVAVLLSTVPDYSEKIAISIIESFTKPIVVSGKKNEITVSIGISQFPKDTKNADALLRKADIAMYYGKSRSKNTYNYFNKEIRNEIYRKLLFEKSLRNAQAYDELEMYYQPIIDLNNGSIVSAEALIRWNHPEYGLISPPEFIPIAEENGLIVQIGEWVLSTVCKQNIEWQRMGLQPITVAVNISYYQLKDINFTSYLENLLIESGLMSHFLELEITESILRDAKELRFLMEELRLIGLKFAIDDFGVGYSSLSVLQHVSFNKLKLDMSFIREIPNNSKSKAMVKAIIELGKIIGCTIVAEGVETQAQIDFLKKNNCNYAQGYLFSKPINADKFTELLANWKQIKY